MRIRTLVLGLGLSAGSVVAPIVLAGPASAAGSTYVAPTPPQVMPPAQVVTPTPAAPSAAAPLAFTGGDIAGMAIVGVGAIGAGTLLVRRRTRTAAS
jgi:hypothetical protein